MSFARHSLLRFAALSTLACSTCQSTAVTTSGSMASGSAIDGAAPPPSQVPVVPLASVPPRSEAHVVPIATLPQTFTPAKLTFDGLADATPETTRWDVGGVFSQRRHLASDDEALEVVVRAHGDESLAGFERDHASWRLGRRSSTTVCAQAAEMVRASREAEHVACVVTSDGHNHPVYLPPREEVAVGFEHAGLHVVVSILVTAEDTSAYADVVTHILQSIRCL